MLRSRRKMRKREKGKSRKRRKRARTSRFWIYRLLACSDIYVDW